LQAFENKSKPARPSVSYGLTRLAGGDEDLAEEPKPAAKRMIAGICLVRYHSFIRKYEMVLSPYYYHYLLD